MVKKAAFIKATTQYYFFSILYKALDDLHAYFSFLHHLYKVAPVLCKLHEMKSMKYLARIKLIQFK